MNSVSTLCLSTLLFLAAMTSEGPAAAVKIVALGDSTTAGTPGFTSPLEDPPNGRGDETSQYAYWLMKAHPEWTVLNRGVNGERSDQIRARFDRDVIQASPAAVVIIAGVNDIYQGRTVDHVIEQLHGMYARATSAGILVVAGSIVPYNTATPEQNTRMRQINDWIRRQRDIAFADTRSAVAASGNPDKLLESPDGLHPTAAGYHRMADAIAAVLERRLR
jgi:lysophospholipase L1-like esterase